MKGIIKWGKYRGKQVYKCKECKKVFVLEKKWYEEAYEEYCFKRQSYKALSEQYGKHPITVQRNFDKMKINWSYERSKEKEINLILDGVYFGWGLCYVVLRANGRNIYFKQCNETINNVLECLREAEGLGYKYKSFTVDGRRGIIEMIEREYPGVPIQHCQFHQKKTIRKYLTKEPKTECGQELLAFLRPITRYSKEEFEKGINSIEEKYKEFLIERNEQGRYKHRKIRSALRSLRRNLAYLFTYREERYKHLNIPNTTNACEGYFKHLRSRVGAHPGLVQNRKRNLIERILYGEQK